MRALSTTRTEGDALPADGGGQLPQPGAAAQPCRGDPPRLRGVLYRCVQKTPGPLGS